MKRVSPCDICGAIFWREITAIRVNHLIRKKGPRTIRNSIPYLTHSEFRKRYMITGVHPVKQPSRKSPRKAHKIPVVITDQALIGTFT